MPNSFLALRHKQIDQGIDVRSLYPRHERIGRNAALLQGKGIRQYRHTRVRHQSRELGRTRALAGCEDTVLDQEQRHGDRLRRQVCKQAVAFLDVA